MTRKMETPLDVLSRAASMVETNGNKGEPSLYKRNLLESHDVHTKELPTKFQKKERLKERQELPQTLNFSREHITKFHSSSHDVPAHRPLPEISERELPPPYMNGDLRHAMSLESYNLSRGISHSVLSQSSHVLRERGSPPQYGSIPMDTHGHDKPLNLSLTNTSSSAFTVSRPSVITCASTIDKNPSNYGNSSPSRQSLLSPSRRESSVAAISDPAIEEHFRRSLGRNYSDMMSPKSAPEADSPPIVESASVVMNSSKLTQSQKPQAVSITGSVDDHFAKSLGNTTWSAIKAKTDTVQEMLPDTVDDHFAKALGGDTWLRIKADKERTPSSTTSNGSSSPPSPLHRLSPSSHRHDSVLTT